MNNKSIRKIEDYLQKIFDLEIEIESLKFERSLHKHEIDLYKQMYQDLHKLSLQLIA